MKNPAVFLIPQTNTVTDTVEEELTLFEVVDIDAGKFLGVTGIRLPSDDENGYDAVFGWQDPFGVRSTAPYKNLSDAVDGLAEHALTNGGEEL